MADWLSFIRDMVKRGLCIPTTITSNGAPRLIKAIEAAFALSPRIRCWFHKMQNLMEKVPSEAWPEAKAELIGMKDAKDYQTGLMLSQPPESPLLSPRDYEPHREELCRREEKDQGDTGIFCREVSPQVGIFKFNKGSQEMAQDHFH